MNLKTLKDLSIKDTHRWVKTEELKAEAVKWVKYYEKDDKTFWLKRTEWIKHFFNITEEDLK